MVDDIDGTAAAGEQQVQGAKPVGTQDDAGLTPLSAEEIQKQMGELRRAKEEQAAATSDDESLMSGVMEEVGLIQWPTFGSAFLNTLLVIAIVFGTSLVLFGVNSALTEISGTIYSH